MELAGGPTPALVMWSVEYTFVILVWFALYKYEVSHESQKKIRDIIHSVQCLSNLIPENALLDHGICHYWSK
jgi:hypothetical protein